jgi:hypothetical protein
VSAPRLTPLLREQILAGIRAGGYPHVAAEAWGVPREDFDDWLRRGRGIGARQPYRSFVLDVQQAHAQARLKAEIETFENDAKIWLEHGPGKETTQRPGWSSSARPVDGATQSGNVFEQPEIVALMRVLLDSVEPFPDARARAAGVLHQLAPQTFPSRNAS